jgi:putative ABC transport system ATP-binding protein
LEATTKELMIEATGVQKVYDAGGLRVRALRGLDLGVRRGEMVAIMGPSGCGKTTLLNVLSGLDDLSDGEIYVDGRAHRTIRMRDGHITSDEANGKET